jgi:HPt (histidine-containing phosphotransfer) domain-containing protein
VVTQQRFDLIFMDIQMPDLDGLEVTRRLRARGGWSAQIPIVAMTAGGGGGEQARCLAVGMNGYLTKPLFTDALAAVLRRHLTSVGASALPVFPDRWSTVSAGHPLDHTTVEALRESLGAAGLEALVALYRQQAYQRLEELDDAIEAGSSDWVIHLAHQIKGESSSLGAVKMAGLASRLEQLGRNRQLENASLLRRQLLACLGVTLSALEASPSDGTVSG